VQTEKRDSHVDYSAVSCRWPFTLSNSHAIDARARARAGPRYSCITRIAIWESISRHPRDIFTNYAAAINQAGVRARFGREKIGSRGRLERDRRPSGATV